METLEASPVSNDEIPTDYNSDEALELDATKMTDAKRRVLAVRLQKTLAKERAKTARLLKVREEELAELEKKAAAALDREKSLAMNSLLSFLSNPLQVYDVSGSTACAEPIVSYAIRTKLFEASKIIYLDDNPRTLTEDDFSPLWKVIDCFRCSSWAHCKEGVALYVSRLIFSVIFAMGKHKDYCVTTFMNSRSDLAIVERATDRTIGIVSVKMPGTVKQSNAVFGTFVDGILKDGNKRSGVAGQVYDQLCSLQSTDSPKKLALLTNWNEWQLIAIDDSILGELDSEVSATPVPAPRRHSVRELAQLLVATFKCLVAKFKPAPNRIFVSNVVHLLDKDDKNGFKLGKFLEHVIDMMIKSSVQMS
jgi:hypothetical protein